MASLAEIYDWFMTGKKPTQPQFWASWGSFWNKLEQIPQSSIAGLPGVLNAKAEKAQFDAHKTDENAHAGLFSKSRIFQVGSLQVFKTKTPEDEDYEEGQQIGDYCIGFVINDDEQLEFIYANYLGGDIMQKSSYNI